MTQPAQTNIILEPGQNIEGMPPLWPSTAQNEPEQEQRAPEHPRKTFLTNLEEPEDIEQEIKKRLGLLKKSVDLAPLATRIQNIVLPDTEDNATVFNLRDNGIIRLQDDRITADGIANPQNEQFSTAYEDNAALMVAHTIERGWPSIAVNGSDKNMKDAVFVEAFLQGIPVDLANSRDYTRTKM